MVKLKDEAFAEIDALAEAEGLMVAGHPNRSAMGRLLISEAIAARRTKAARLLVRDGLEKRR